MFVLEIGQLGLGPLTFSLICSHFPYRQVTGVSGIRLFWGYSYQFKGRYTLFGGVHQIPYFFSKFCLLASTKVYPDAKLIFLDVRHRKIFFGSFGRSTVDPINLTFFWESDWIWSGYLSKEEQKLRGQNIVTKIRRNVAGNK